MAALPVTGEAEAVWGVTWAAAAPGAFAGVAGGADEAGTGELAAFGASGFSVPGTAFEDALWGAGDG
jgi:hypothetical protein